MKKILLIDRDGVLIQHVHHLHSTEEVYIEKQAGVAIEVLECYKIKPVIVTNQSVIGRGFITHKQLDHIHHYIEDQLGTMLDWFYCPHLPTDGCECRKPNIGLYKEIMEVYPDYEIIGMIGDNDSDLEFAKNINVPGYKVDSEHDLLYHVIQITSKLPTNGN